MVNKIKYGLILILTAFIWGITFSFQRQSMLYIGPFFYNASRFLLGSLTLLPFIIFTKKNDKKTSSSVVEDKKSNTKSKFYLFGIGAGVCLFFGAAFQQMGIVYTSAAKAGFITGLYIVLVPVIGLFFKQRSKMLAWIGTAISTIGLYFLSITGDFTIVKGDLLVLISALFWALHVNIIGKSAPGMNVLRLSFLQFLTCSVLSFITALIFETITLKGLFDALFYIFFAGVVSVGLAYTLQVFAQKKVPPANAALILSLESVFALLGGVLIINEVLNNREIIGCIIMFSGIILSQIQLSAIQKIIYRKDKIFQVK